MKTKIVGICIFMLLITGVLTVSGVLVTTVNQKNNIVFLDQLDQKSAKMDKPQKIGSSGTELARRLSQHFQH